MSGWTRRPLKDCQGNEVEGWDGRTDAWNVRLGNVVEFGRQWEQLVSSREEKVRHKATSRGQGEGPAEPYKVLASGGHEKWEGSSICG